MDIIRPTWAEISLRAIRENIASTRRLIRPETRLMAVVKANAYGHGMAEIAEAAGKAGADYLGVASLDEARVLRERDITTPILVLGYTPAHCADYAFENDVELTVFDYETGVQMASRAQELSRRARIHIKIDTGMNRIGFQPDEDSLQAVNALGKLPGLELAGLFSHFSVADERDKSFSHRQFRLFQDFTDNLKSSGLTGPIQHIANSAAIIDMPEAQLDMVRAGIMIYGFYPSPEVNRDRVRLEPAMHLYTRVVQVKNLEAGESVSYGRTYTALAPIMMATVPIGYADGYSRLLSNRIWAVIRGQQAKQIGTICMDQCMFDVSHIPGVVPGDRVVLFGSPAEGVTADDVAEAMGTINYEVVCKVSVRVPRIYVD